MSKQGWHIFLSKAHKWVGLILGIQILFWTIGGVVMSWIPLDQVRGEHKINSQPPTALVGELLAPSELLEFADTGLINIEYTDLLGTPVAKLTTTGGSKQLHNAITGEQISPISANLATSIATDDFALGAPVKSVSEVSTASPDYRGPFPVWKIVFEDAENSAIYVSQTEGRVVARRSTIWRFYDFFWMLHIMDYDERHDFNNPLIMLTSLFASLFVLTGFCLLVFRFHRRDFNFILGKEK